MKFNSVVQKPFLIAGALAFFIASIWIGIPVVQQAMGQGIGSVSSFVCTPIGIAVVPGSTTLQGSRIHVQCEELRELTVSYYALSTRDISAPLVLSLLESAIIHNKQVRVSYNTDSVANPEGCRASDCRKIEAIDLLP